MGGTLAARARIRGVVLGTARKPAVSRTGVLLMERSGHRYDRLSKRLDECRNTIEKPYEK